MAEEKKGVNNEGDSRTGATAGEYQSKSSERKNHQQQYLQ